MRFRTTGSRMPDTKASLQLRRLLYGGVGGSLGATVGWVTWIPVLAVREAPQEVVVSVLVGAVIGFLVPYVETYFELASEEAAEPADRTERRKRKRRAARVKRQRSKKAAVA